LFGFVIAAVASTFCCYKKTLPTTAFKNIWLKLATKAQWEIQAYFRVRPATINYLFPAESIFILAVSPYFG